MRLVIQVNFCSSMVERLLNFAISWFSEGADTKSHCARVKLFAVLWTTSWSMSQLYCVEVLSWHFSRRLLGAEWHAFEFKQSRLMFPLS